MRLSFGFVLLGDRGVLERITGAGSWYGFEGYGSGMALGQTFLDLEPPIMVASEGAGAQ